MQNGRVQETEKLQKRLLNTLDTNDQTSYYRRNQNGSVWRQFFVVDISRKSKLIYSAGKLYACDRLTVTTRLIRLVSSQQTIVYFY